MSIKSYEKNSEPKSEQITKQDLVSALDKVSYDKAVVLDMIDKHPDMLKTLIDAKDKEGKPLFDALAIDDVLFNCKDTIEKHPDRITAILSNPEEIDGIADWGNRGAGLWRAVGDPLQSTIDKNPKAFGIEPKNEENITKGTDDTKKEEIVKDNATDKKNTNKFADLRKRLAQKVDKALGTNIEKVKIPNKIKQFENAISKKFGKGGR